MRIFYKTFIKKHFSCVILMLHRPCAQRKERYRRNQDNSQISPFNQTHFSCFKEVRSYSKTQPLAINLQLSPRFRIAHCRFIGVQLLSVAAPAAVPFFPLLVKSRYRSIPPRRDKLLSLLSAHPSCDLREFPLWGAILRGYFYIWYLNN